MGFDESIDYQKYIQSPEWRRVRERYWKSKLPKECYICGKPRHPGMHLHHRTYKNLGHERLMDLVPVCEACHTLIHQKHDESVRKDLWIKTLRALITTIETEANGSDGATAYRLGQIKALIARYRGEGK